MKIRFKWLLTKPPSARHFGDSMPLFEIHICLHVSTDGNMDFTLCDEDKIAREMDRLIKRRKSGPAYEKKE